MTSYSHLHTLPMQGSTSLEFQSIIKSYLDRNFTTAYTNSFPVWKASCCQSRTVSSPTTPIVGVLMASQQHYPTA